MTGFEVLKFLLLALNLLLLPFFLEILVTTLAAIFYSEASSTAPAPHSRFLIVIPAHDEEVGIAETVRSCRAQDYPDDFFHVLVIADNCSDRTAQIASRKGAEVIERSDPVKKTKGYAIEYLIAKLEQTGRLDSWDALVVVDADTVVSPDLLSRFSATLDRGFDWMQCLYLVGNPEASWRTKLMTYAFMLINGVTPLGLTRLGQSTTLNGNGMCFSVRGLRRIPWKSYGLVEDYEYSWVVRLAGERIAFVPGTCVKAKMLPDGGEAAANQRRRWEFGRSEIKKRMLGPVFRSRKLSWIEKVPSTIELTMPTMVTLLTEFIALSCLNLAAISLSHHPFSHPLPLALLFTNFPSRSPVGAADQDSLHKTGKGRTRTT